VARALRIEYPGAFQHVTARGVARQDLFFGDADREQFLRFLADVHTRWGLRIHAFCLMTNHYHLEVETPEGHLSRPIQWLNQNYAAYLNRTHDRSGHLFQGRFHSVVVESESHLDALTRYVHLNPVRAGVVTNAARYGWSSYAAYLGLRKKPAWLEIDATLERFGSRRSTQRRRYRAFVEHEAATDPLLDVQFGAVLGTQRFVDWVRAELTRRSEDPEITGLGQAKAPVTVPQICAAVCRAWGVTPDALHEKGRWGNESRDVAIYLARMHAGCTLAEIGHRLGGVRPSAVSLAHRRVTQQMRRHRTFRRRVEDVQADLLNAARKDHISKM